MFDLERASVDILASFNLINARISQIEKAALGGQISKSDKVYIANLKQKQETIKRRTDKVLSLIK